ncbi:GEVED domain-containing protein [Halioglobus japonicus]|uniref:GEVED domain-containing protein n=1 Tax=Halioglobus japonicus TaxID=930805 RepID=UPI0011AF4432|nr:GEVED domain-containing protein [Halioglobus japonicus]
MSTGLAATQSSAYSFDWAAATRTDLGSGVFTYVDTVSGVGADILVRATITPQDVQDASSLFEEGTPCTNSCAFGAPFGQLELAANHGSSAANPDQRVEITIEFFETDGSTPVGVSVDTVEVNDVDAGDSGGSSFADGYRVEGFPVSVATSVPPTSFIPGAQHDVIGVNGVRPAVTTGSSYGPESRFTFGFEGRQAIERIVLTWFPVVEQLPVYPFPNDNPTVQGSSISGFSFERGAAFSDFGDIDGYADASHSAAALIETREVSGSNDDWVTVNLRGKFVSPVVVCTPVLPSVGDDERVLRVRNVGSGSFQIRAQRPGKAFSAQVDWDATCLVAESGEQTLPDGRRILAGTVTSTVTNYGVQPTFWDPASTADVTPLVPFVQPAVFGQVMTFNDERFSVFWSNDCVSELSPPDADGICVGKHVAEDVGILEDDGPRANETLGYVIVETESGTTGLEAQNGVAYEVALGSDFIQGVTNPSTPPGYTLTPATTEYVSGVATLAAMDGFNGGWAVLFGTPPIDEPQPPNSGLINLRIDEDTIQDDERQHTTEQVAYWVFDRQNVLLTAGPYLGVVPPDLESGSQSNAGADGDDTNDTSEVGAGNDEDGVVFTYTSPGTIQASVTVNNFANTVATVCAWLDVPSGAVGDGSFDTTDLGTPGCVPVPTNSAGPQTPVQFVWTGLPTSVPYSTYARVRISTDALTAADAAGEASDGEVEDYQIVVDPTAVTLASFSLEAMPIEQLLGPRGAPEQVLLAMLASWDENQAELLGDASREDIAVALIDYLDPDGDGQVAQLIWETLEEYGTLGFYVERRGSEGGWNRVNQRMLPALPIAPMGAEYQLLDPEADLQQVLRYRLIEQEARGSTRTYGPFTLDASP